MSEDHAYFHLAEELLRENADKLAALEKHRLNHLLFIILTIPVASFLLSPVPMIAVISQTGQAEMPYWLSALITFIVVLFFIAENLDRG